MAREERRARARSRGPDAEPELVVIRWWASKVGSGASLRRRHLRAPTRRILRIQFASGQHLFAWRSRWGQGGWRRERRRLRRQRWWRVARTAHLHVVRAEPVRKLSVILNWITQLATRASVVDTILAARIRVQRVCPVAELDAKADWDEYVVHVAGASAPPSTASSSSSDVSALNLREMCRRDDARAPRR